MKSIIIASIAIALILAFGIVEFVILENEYKKINDETLSLMDKAQNKTITVDDMEEFTKNWVALREKAEILLPHVDVYECNLRIAESKGFVTVGDFDNAYVQLSVVEELTRYIPHLMKPIWVHIV